MPILWSLGIPFQVVLHILKQWLSYSVVSQQVE